MYIISSIYLYKSWFLAHRASTKSSNLSSTLKWFLPCSSIINAGRGFDGWSYYAFYPCYRRRTTTNKLYQIWKACTNLLESASSIHPIYIVKRYTCLVAAFNKLVSLKILQLLAWNSRYGWDRQNFGGGPLKQEIPTARRGNSHLQKSVYLQVSCGSASAVEICKKGRWYPGWKRDSQKRSLASIRLVQS